VMVKTLRENKSVFLPLFLVITTTKSVGFSGRNL
jgi:hypothetical protein